MKEKIRHKLLHGIPPLTLDECRWLFEQAFHERVPHRVRCPRCEGSGLSDSNTLCVYCQHKGYIDK